MGKRARERDLPANEAKAVTRMIRISPQKLNLVAQMIRGKKVAGALADLEFSRKRIAKDVRKCLESAIANAENNHDLDVDDLLVADHGDQAGAGPAQRARGAQGARRAHLRGHPLGGPRGGARRGARAGCSAGVGGGGGR